MLFKSYTVRVVENPTTIAMLTFAVLRRNSRRTLVVIGKSLSWGQIVLSGIWLCTELELWALQGFIERVKPNGWTHQGPLA